MSSDADARSSTATPPLFGSLFGSIFRTIGEREALEQYIQVFLKSDGVIDWSGMKEIQ